MPLEHSCLWGFFWKHVLLEENSGGPQMKNASLPHLRFKVLMTFGAFPFCHFEF